MYYVARMRTPLAFVVLVALFGCPSKQQDGGGGSGSQVAVPKPMTCAPGSVIDNGMCILVVTPAKIEAVAQQQTRIDDLAKLLDKIDSVGAPLELLDALRKLDVWKTFSAANAQAKLVDDSVAALANALNTLRAFKASLGEISARLGNLKGELDRLLKDPGAARQLAEVRTQISTQLRSAIEPFAAQVVDATANAITPLLAKLDQIGAMVDIACGTIRLSGGENAKALCKDSHEVFAKGLAYLEDFKVRPAQLFDQVTKELERQLDVLVDAEANKLVVTAQAKVNELLKLPATGSAAPATP